MAIQRYKPTSPGRRGMSSQDFASITKGEPEKKLLETKNSSGGRNAYGRTTVRFRGGGHKRRYRKVDFKRQKTGIPAKVLGIEYDPNRSARIALIQYVDGEKAYILAPAKLSSATRWSRAERGLNRQLPAAALHSRSARHPRVVSRSAPARTGPLGRARITLMAKEGTGPPSDAVGEMRRVHVDCRASIGTVGNSEHANIEWGKAGRRRWLGRRPHNRGVSMNPVDHPMGGGEGRSSGGRHPCSPWGMPTKGYKTRENKATDKYIVRRRGKKG